MHGNTKEGPSRERDPTSYGYLQRARISFISEQDKESLGIPTRESARNADDFEASWNEHNRSRCRCTTEEVDSCLCAKSVPSLTHFDSIRQSALRSARSQILDLNSLLDSFVDVDPLDIFNDPRQPVSLDAEDDEFERDEEFERIEEFVGDEDEIAFTNLGIKN